MGIKITVFAENTVRGRIEALGEAGISFFLETDSGNYLFDTGRGHVILHNALVFRKDIRSLKKIFVSHSHPDHTGGLDKVLRLTGEIEVMAHPDIFLQRVRLRDQQRVPTGVPFTRDYLEGMGARFHLSREFRPAAPDIYLTGEIPRRTSFETGDYAGRFLITEGGWIPDPILDDQSLVLDTPDGLVIVLGCAHAGIVNTITHVLEKTGKNRIRAVLGGTHLAFSAPEQLTASLQALKQFDIGRIGVSHCTGLEASARVAQEFEDRAFYCNVGTALEF